MDSARRRSLKTAPERGSTVAADQRRGSSFTSPLETRNDVTQLRLMTPSGSGSPTSVRPSPASSFRSRRGSVAIRMDQAQQSEMVDFQRRNSFQIKPLAKEQIPVEGELVQNVATISPPPTPDEPSGRASEKASFRRRSTTKSVKVSCRCVSNSTSVIMPASSAVSAFTSDMAGYRISPALPDRRALPLRAAIQV